MGRLFVLPIALILGCAGAEDAPSSTPASDSGAASDVTIDSGATDASASDSGSEVRDEGVVDVSPDVIFPVEDVGPPPVCGVPKATTATASATNGSFVPANAVDGSLTTLWYAGATTGTLKLAFPTDLKFDRVRIAAKSLLGTGTPTVTLVGHVGKTTPTIGTAKPTVTTATAWLPVINVTPGTYSGLDVALNGGLIQLAEVYVFDSTAGCTLPP